MEPRDRFARGIGTFCNDDDKDRRIAELQELQDHKAAELVSKCGDPNAGWQTRHCRRRDCTECAQKLSQRYGLQVLEGVKTFKGQKILVGLFAITVDLLRLHEGFGEFRKALLTIRRTEPMRSQVLGGSGSLEPKLVANGTRWNLHAHLLLDAAGSFDAKQVAEQWKAHTGGLFSIDPKNPEVLSPAAFAAYAAKPASWAPRPGDLELRRYEHLRRGIKGKQLVVRWGTARRPGAA